MNIIFDNVKVYGVQDRLDVVLGVTFVMEPLSDFPEGFEVLSTKDSRLSIADDDRTVTTTKIGVSNIKFMTGDLVHKNLYIHIVDATHPAATALNGSLGEPVQK
jgi:hypothetical protein